MKKQVLIWLNLITIFIIILGITSGLIYGKTFSKEIIYLDPGHGGFDGGATSSGSTIPEKNIVLTVSLYLKDYLEKMGYKVLLTRDKDQALAKTKKEDIYKRVELINNSAALLYVSIHANTYTSNLAHGAQVFYHNNENNKSLSELIQETLKIIDDTNTRFAKSITGKYLLDHVNKTGCLVEIGFLSNVEDLARLQDDSYLQNIALMIYLGIIQYLAI